MASDPNSPAGGPDDARTPSGGSASDWTQAGPEEPLGDDLSVLIVDDNEQNLELMHAYVDGLGPRLRLARDGQEAVAAIEAEAPDLVLLDIMMPRMSGYQVCQWIKSRRETRDVPVIMVTALGEVGDVERALDHGADDFLTKPINRVDLVTRVRTQLRVRRLRHDLEATQSELRRLRGERP
ncbi:MAG: response regulator [Planctomycetota bacterium]